MRRTSKLLETGCFCCFRDQSVPFYMPLGQAVLDGIRQVINQHSRRYGLNQVSLPTIVQDEILRQGQEIHQSFKDKMMLLDGDMQGHHLLFTPEPIIHDLATACLLSHRQLPIRLCYHVDMFRNVNDARGMLKTRQFQIFAGTTIEPNQQSTQATLDSFEQLTVELLQDLGVPVRTCHGRNSMAFELFYLAHEGESLFIPELNPSQKINALSLAMAYQYCAEKKLSARFQDAQNSRRRILMTTYAVGVQRLFYAVFDAHRDSLGFQLPEAVRPADVTIIPNREADRDYADQLYRQLIGLGRRPILDDRRQHSYGKRAAFADYIGAPWKLKVDGVKLTLTNRGLTESFTDTRTDLVKRLCEHTDSRGVI